MSDKKRLTKKTDTKSAVKDNKVLNNIKNVLNKIKIVIIKFLKKRWQLILMNIVIFILTVFIESIYIYNLKMLVWIFNTVLFIVIPTIVFTLKTSIKSKDIVISVPILYILFLMFLNYCTIRELYGISSLGIDKTPNYVDALFVVFIFTFIEYVVVLLVNKIKGKK